MFRETHRITCNRNIPDMTSTRSLRPSPDKIQSAFRNNHLHDFQLESYLRPKRAPRCLADPAPLLLSVAFNYTAIQINMVDQPLLTQSTIKVRKL